VCIEFMWLRIQNGPEVGSREHGGKLLGSMKGAEFLD
jgi:hypothetical protein